MQGSDRKPLRNEGMVANAPQFPQASSVQHRGDTLNALNRHFTVDFSGARPRHWKSEFLSITGENSIKTESLKYRVALSFAFLAMEIWMLPNGVSPAFGASEDDPPPTAWVEESTPLELKPTIQIADTPSQTYAGIIVLSKSSIPANWSEPDAEVDLPATPSSLAGTLTTNVTTAVVAVMFIDALGQSLRFGYGLQSNVAITLNSGEAHTFSSSAFQMAAETSSASLALDGAESLNTMLAQTASAQSTTSGYYSNCVGLCLANSHAILWDLLNRCAEVAGVVGVVGSGACALACLLTGPGWPAGVLACVEVLGLPILMLIGTCLAAYIAGMTVAIPLCTIGCIW
jgi:hypothetical protein